MLWISLRYGWGNVAIAPMLALLPLVVFARVLI
jgi:hypothetical protein